MRCWICLPEQLNEWYQTITPVEFYNILKSDTLPLYNYVGAPREWHLRQLPGRYSFLYTSIAIAHACYFSAYRQLITGKDENIYYATLDILASIDSEAYHYICSGYFDINSPERTIKLFVDKYEEFKENIQSAFLWAEGTFLNTVDTKYFIEAYTLKCTNENIFKIMADHISGTHNRDDTKKQQEKYDANELTAKEKRELGSLRNEKKKHLRSIEVATRMGPVVEQYIKTSNRPITRKIFHNLLRDHDCLDIPFTTIDKIWKWSSPDFVETFRLKLSGSESMHPFVSQRRHVVESRMSPMGIVPAFDEIKHGQSGLLS